MENNENENSILLDKTILFNDLLSSMVNQNFVVNCGVELKADIAIDKIPIRKPCINEKIKVLDIGSFVKSVFHIKGTDERFFLNEITNKKLKCYLKKEILHISMNNSGYLFVWPIKCIDGQYNNDTWNSSALYATAKAKNNWIYVVSNKKEKKYDFELAKDFDDVLWPLLDWNLIVQKLIKFHTITENHLECLVKLYPIKESLNVSNRKI
ncbi:hypothetical protein [Solidesulfovibrio sp. C21]|uniref:hypothetical protein n=1 Tax=Solidesulfovibrio sp. C21 TaxID=3398613 RepID=UPI0039FDBF93